MPHPVRTSLLALCLGASALQPVLAQTAPAGDIVVNMRGIEIADVAEQISRLTGRTLILDPTVKGQVTVTSAEPLSSAGVWELFQSVLRANGFAAVRSGSAWRIVPAANAVRDGGARGGGQALTTRMVRLSNVPAADAARIVRPLVASFGSVEPLSSPNAIVVTDYADNVARIEALARSLDGGGGSSFATIPLQHGNANDVAQAMQGVLGDAASGTGARVAADARSNTVVVRGTPAAVAEARRIAQALDAPGGATPVTRVFRLNHADAEAVTEVLRGVLGQEASAANPVARSLSTRGRAGSGASSPTSALSNLISGNTAAQAAAAGSTTQGLSGSGGAATMGEQTPTPQGFATPDVTVQPAPDINALVVRGTPAAVAQIERLIPDLDVRRPQVLIEAAIAEIVGDDAERLAVQLGTSGAALTSVTGAGTSFSSPSGVTPLSTILQTLGVPAGGILGEGLTANIGIGNDFSILVQALGTSSKANLLSTPQITTLDNKMGEIVVAQEVPFITGSILTDTTNANPYTSIERRDVGITLRVLPRINAGDTIRLEVAQEASSISPTQVAAAADIITNKRSINTTVLAENGQTIVLGGLTADDYNRLKSQVPILGDIPVLGELFKSRQESRTKRTLFIFLKPTILRDSATAAAETQTRYDRLRGDEAQLGEKRSLLLNPPRPRLSVEIDGIY
ncbi:type II secretion system secretin GspD [Sphingomonas sp. PL-96]|uniref:type II secretion system secretin GspD n=1 Tax=Sphingomonas sp. PL-96 TaxID=2887201 RepID=UPI001E4684FC|nr:type II secretion system secretin GspD [Sphingomonas sp. PL-96]MCC2977850.1 type II secretion system secretin GspD [Sphingomonas sp. PL-96]